jgi:rubrerythrin
LAGKGFKEVYNLKGGIAAWHGLTAFGPVEMGMARLKGDEKPDEVVILAYGMETGLGEFYSRIAGTIAEPAIATLLMKLAGIEENHRQRLFRLYTALDPATADQRRFENRIVSEVMEGGFTTDEFMERNRAAMSTRENVLSIAMMLETQALDLYMRYSQKIKDDRSKSLFHDLAEEEKSHLESLGRLMEAGT